MTWCCTLLEWQLYTKTSSWDVFWKHCFVVLEFGNRDFCRGEIAPMFRPQEFEHRLQIIDDKHADLQVSLFVKTTRALEEVLAKKKGKLYHHYLKYIYFLHIWYFIQPWGVFWGCFFKAECIPYLPWWTSKCMTNSQHFQARIKAQFTVRPKCQCHPFRLLAGFLSESWHTRWAQKASSYKYGYHSTSRGVIVPVIHLYTFKNKNISRGAHNFI